MHILWDILYLHIIMSYSLWFIQMILTSFGHITPTQKKLLAKKYSLTRPLDVFTPTPLTELCKQYFFFD